MNMQPSRISPRRRALAVTSALAVAAALTNAAPARAGTTVFSSGGFSLPETIVAAPSGFAPGAAYVIPDPTINGVGPGAVFAVGAGGGAPTLLANLGKSALPDGGVFLPSGYGALSGQFLAVGTSTTGNGTLTAVSGAGAVTPLLTSSTVGQFEGGIVAPAGFGSVGGQVLVGAGNAVDVLGPTGKTLTPFAAFPGGETFGMGLAPAGFGAVGGDLLVSDADSGKFYAINPAGTASLFTTVSVAALTKSTGLRQFAFAPAGYGAFGGDLFLSVSGSGRGGGSLGAIVVLNAAGAVVATFDQGTAANPLDPRGLYFASSTELLASNGDPEIDAITPSSFVGVPEPGALAVLLAGAASLAGARRAGRGRARRAG